MIIQSYLVVELDTDYYDRPKSSLRVVKNKPTLASREIAFQLQLKIPDVFFRRLVPLVKIDLPADVLMNPEPEIALSITADAVAEALKLDAQTVYDGLLEQYKSKETTGGEE